MPSRTVVLSALLWACGGGGTTGPADDTSGNALPVVELVSGGVVADTVGTRVETPVVARVAGSKGLLLSNTQVTVWVTTSVPGVWLRADPAATETDRITTTTDARGEFSFYLTLRTVAGRATVNIRPSGSFATTYQLAVDIQPGKAFEVDLGEAPSLVTVDDTVRFYGAILDQFGNDVPGTVSYATSGPATVSENVSIGTVVGTDVGEVDVIGTAGALADTAHLLMVPHGRIILIHRDGVRAMELDGSLGVNLPMGGVLDVAPAPRGTGVAFGKSGALFASDFVAVAQITGGGPYTSATLPRWASDASVVYFTATFRDRGAEIWRISPDGGTVLEQVTILPTIGDADRFPSVSNTGDRVAFARTTGGSLSGPLTIKELANGTEVPLGVEGRSSRWSPDDQWLAYLDPNAELRRVRLDGTGDEGFTPGVQYKENFGWSPDGRFLIGSNYDWKVRLVEVETGIVRTIAYPYVAWGVEWYPDP